MQRYKKIDVANTLPTRAQTHLLAPILFRYNKHNVTYVDLYQEVDTDEKCYPLTRRAAKKEKESTSQRNKAKQHTYNFKVVVGISLLQKHIQFQINTLVEHIQFQINCFPLAIFESAHNVASMTSYQLHSFAWFSKTADIRHNRVNLLYNLYTEIGH